uniref:HMG box-containing protein 4 n=1 Tax=Lygus hesperus TaxID=30085 RepID=A0A146M0P8_LYGHE
MDKKYKRKDDSFDFASKRGGVKQESELEVTGVSRSGRVRKKSSKLMDFENLDEIDIRASASKKKEKAENALASVNRQTKKEQQRQPIVKEEVLTDEIFNSLLQDLGDTSVPYTKQERLSDESDHEIGYPPQEDSSMESMGSDMDDMDGNNMGRVEAAGFQSIAGDADFSNTSQSLYMMEKTNSKKKLVIKDGKIVGRTKSQRKDKGIWKRRAKRAADSAKVSGGRQQQNQQQQPPHHIQQVRQQTETKKMRSPPGRKFINKGQKELISPTNNSMMSVNASQDAKGAPKPHGVDQTVYKAVGTTPLDVAAHIRLLGESLTIIGERLTEHEGQIAVSGSFSVLLDSLLCVLAPLMCLTQQVPQMNVIPQEQLSSLMDNIAYIMPGL